VGCTKNYTYHVKYTVVVQTPEGKKTGASVVEVSYSDGRNDPIQRMGMVYNAGMRGEAAVVDLGHGRYLFALVVREGMQYAPYDAVAAHHDISERTIWELMPRLGQYAGKPLPLPRNAFPLLVTFEDVRDPKTVKKVDPDNLAAAFGPGYRLKSVTLEITDAPVTRGRVEKVLGWLINAEYIIPPSQQPYYAKDQTIEQKLMPSDFIDWRTLKSLRERN
jgi:hypothetical protein